MATRAVNYIGKSYWNEGMFQGDIAEIILYNRKDCCWSRLRDITVSCRASVGIGQIALGD